MENRKITIYSPIGRPKLVIKTDANHFSLIREQVRQALGIPSFENLKAIFDRETRVEMGYDVDKINLDNLELPNRELSIYLTQDKTSNGFDLEKGKNRINELEIRIEKARKHKKRVSHLIEERNKLAKILDDLLENEELEELENEEPSFELVEDGMPVERQVNICTSTTIFKEESTMSMEEVRNLLEAQQPESND